MIVPTSLALLQSAAQQAAAVGVVVPATAHSPEEGALSLST